MERRLTAHRSSPRTAPRATPWRRLKQTAGSGRTSTSSSLPRLSSAVRSPTAAPSCPPSADASPRPRSTPWRSTSPAPPGSRAPAEAAIALRAQRDADLHDDVDEPAGAERTPEPIRAVGQLHPRPRREACVERRPRVGVHRAVGQNGKEPTAERDEQRAIRKLDHWKGGRPTVLPTPPEVREREPGLHPRDPSVVTR